MPREFGRASPRGITESQHVLCANPDLVTRLMTTRKLLRTAWLTTAWRRSAGGYGECKDGRLGTRTRATQKRLSRFGRLTTQRQRYSHSTRHQNYALDVLLRQIHSTHTTLRRTIRNTLLSYFTHDRPRLLLLQMTAKHLRHLRHDPAMPCRCLLLLLWERLCPSRWRSDRATPRLIIPRRRWMADRPRVSLVASPSRDHKQTIQRLSLDQDDIGTTNDEVVSFIDLPPNTLSKLPEKGILKKHVGYGGGSPPTSLPACHRWPAACLIQGDIRPCWHTSTGPPRGRANAALRPPPGGRKGRRTLGNAKQVAEAWDQSTKARWTHRLIPNIRVWIERRHGELNYHLTQLLTGHGFFKHHSRRYDHNHSAQCPVCPSSIENAEHVFYHCPRFNEERERLQALLHEAPCRPKKIIFVKKRGFWLQKILEYFSAAAESVCQHVLVVVLYRQPDGPAGLALTLFFSVLDNYRHSFKNIIIMGNFNVDMNRCDNFSRHLSTLIHERGLYLVPSPNTHFTYRPSSTLIDLTIIDESSKLLRYSIDDVPIAGGHCVTVLGYRLPSRPVNYREVTYRDFRNCDVAVLRDLVSADMADLFSSERKLDITALVSAFNECVVRCFDRCAPFVTRPFRRPPAPWFTPELQRSCRERDSLYRLERRLGSSRMLQEYKIRRRAIKALIFEARRAYLAVAVEAAPDQASVWSLLRYEGVLPSSRGVVCDRFSPDVLNQHYAAVAGAHPPCSLAKYC
ncbi:unnamed protein product [Trichogramma brassicae]|uniref:Endonuclease/exonuclease/phosphatase domain-containing protein n=1 Tax=Trichogramma brassicae TaxID=86971 RepID=A0A6H5IJI7_9HYME|nr:unnamed protein product [Trichogramma brassicae]